MLHPAIVILAEAVLMGCLVSVFYTRYVSQGSNESDARQGLLNKTTSSTLAALTSSMAEAQAKYSSIQTRLSNLNNVADGLARTTSISYGFPETAFDHFTDIKFNNGLTGSNPCVSYNAGVFTLEPNSVYLVFFSLMCDLFPTESPAPYGDPRFVIFRMVDANNNALSQDFTAQPVTRYDHSGLSSVGSFIVTTGAAGSASTSVRFHNQQFGTTMTIRSATSATFVKLA